MAPWGDADLGGLSSHLAALEKVITITGHESRLSSHESIPQRVPDIVWFLSRLWPGTRQWFCATIVEAFHGIQALRAAVRSDTKLVHAHEVGCLQAARWVSRFIGASVVLTVHSQHTLEALAAGHLARGTRDEQFAWHLERSAYAKADFVFTVTSRLRDYVLAAGDVDPSRVRVQLNFVDADVFQPRARSEAWNVLHRGGLSVDPPLVGGDRLILYPGRLSPRKGVDDLIRAAQIIIAQDPGTRFLITGDGPQRSDLESLRSSLGLERYVTFLGVLPSGLVPSLYNVVDAVVLPSVTIEGAEEGTPMSALEAMASGVPIIASAIGGLREIIADGKTGHLVPERSPERLAATIQQVLREDQTSITSSARAYVCQHRSLESYAGELETFLQAIVSPREDVF